MTDLPTDDASRKLMLALAERCEKATGPDRGIDRDLALLLGLYDRPEDLGCFFDLAEAVVGGGGQTYAPSNFTASLDAAMSLAPDGWYLRVEPRFYSEEGQVRWRAHAIRPDWSRWLPYDDWFETIEDIDANKPALALCAAALRARAAML